MKIVHVLWGLGTGGIETMLADITNEQCKVHDVYVITINDIKDCSVINRFDKRVKLLFCNRKVGSKNIIPIIKLNCCISRIHPDVLHLHNSYIAHIIFRRYPMVYTIHSTGLSIEDSKRFKANCAISKAVQQEWKSRGVDTVLVENGIEGSNVRIREAKLRNDESFHIIQVGRLRTSLKGQDVLIKAIKVLDNRKSPIIPRLKVHIVGTGEDERNLKDLVKKLDLEEVFIFEGLKTRNWVYENLCSYDLFVQPSRIEGFGLTVAEACAAEVPILISDIDGPMEIINNGEFGRFFKCGDVENLASNIEDIIINGYSKDMISKASKHIKENYDIKQTVAKYNDIYHQSVAIF